MYCQYFYDSTFSAAQMTLIEKLTLVDTNSVKPFWSPLLLSPFLTGAGAGSACSAPLAWGWTVGWTVGWGWAGGSNLSRGGGENTSWVCLAGEKGSCNIQHIIYLIFRSNSFTFASHVLKYNIIFLETLDTILLNIEGEGNCQKLFKEKEVCFQCFSLNVCSVYENALAENLWKYSRKSIDSDSLAERAGRAPCWLRSQSRARASLANISVTSVAVDCRVVNHISRKFLLLT